MNRLHVTLRQFRRFVALAESGRAVAATRMPVFAQGALSRNLLEPEAEVRSMRFERSSNGMSLTAAGHRFLVLPLPHPSGVSRWLNDPANRARHRQALTLLRELREARGL